MLRSGLNVAEAENEAKSARMKLVYKIGSNEEIVEVVREYVTSYLNNASLSVEFTKEERFALAQAEILVEIAELNDEPKIRLIKEVLANLFKELVQGVVRASATAMAPTEATAATTASTEPVAAVSAPHSLFVATPAVAPASASASVGAPVVAPGTVPFTRDIEGVWTVNLDSFAAANSIPVSALAAAQRHGSDRVSAYTMPVIEPSSNLLRNLRMAALKSRDPRRIHTAVFNHLSPHFSNQDILKQKIAEIISEASTYCDLVRSSMIASALDGSTPATIADNMESLKAMLTEVGDNRIGFTHAQELREMRGARIIAESRIMRDESKGIEADADIDEIDALAGVEQIREAIAAIVLSRMIKDEEEYWRNRANRRRGNDQERGGI